MRGLRRKTRDGIMSAQRSQPGTIILIARRGEGGAVHVSQQADMEVDEFAATMEAMSSLAKAIGWTPGDIAAAHARVMNLKRGLKLAKPNGTDGTGGTDD